VNSIQINGTHLYYQPYKEGTTVEVITEQYKRFTGGK
jgi:hypothetical protein